MIYYVARQVLPPSILKVSVFHYNVMVLSVLIPKNAVPFIYNQCVQIGMGAIQISQYTIQSLCALNEAN